MTTPGPFLMSGGMSIPLAQPMVMTQTGAPHGSFAHAGTISPTPTMNNAFAVPIGSSQLPRAAVANHLTSATSLRQQPPSWTGQAVMCLHRFAEKLNTCDQPTERAFWDDFIQEFFSHRSTMKIGLWNNLTKTTGAFDIHHSLLPRFFHTMYTSGVESIQLTLQQTMEYILPGNAMNVHCPRASLIYRYENGVMIVLEGDLWVQFALEQPWTPTDPTLQGQPPQPPLKITYFEFICHGYQEFLKRASMPKSESPSLPTSPINEWGVPMRVYQFLKLANVSSVFSEVVFGSLVTGTPPQGWLTQMASHIRTVKAAGTTDTDVQQVRLTTPPSRSSTFTPGLPLGSAIRSPLYPSPHLSYSHSPVQGSPYRADTLGQDGSPMMMNQTPLTPVVSSVTSPTMAGTPRRT